MIATRSTSSGCTRSKVAKQAKHCNGADEPAEHGRSNVMPIEAAEHERRAREQDAQRRRSRHRERLL